MQDILCRFKVGGDLFRNAAFLGFHFSQGEETSILKSKVKGSSANQKTGLGSWEEGRKDPCEEKPRVTEEGRSGGFQTVGVFRKGQPGLVRA